MIVFRNFPIGRYHVESRVKGVSLCGVIQIPKAALDMKENTQGSRRSLLLQERGKPEEEKTLCKICTREDKLVPSKCLPIADNTASFLMQVLIEAQEEVKRNSQNQTQGQDQVSKEK